MKKLFTLLFILISLITYSQSGVGYLNYTVYNIINNGTGAYANNSIGFVNMFDITKGATIYTSGTSTAQKTLFFANGWQPSGVPNGGAYTGIKVTGYFVPKETGTYIFGIDGDDGVDFSLDGNVITSFYGAHGFGGYRYGSVNLVAGKSYSFMARYQNWGGGWGMYLVWKRPSQSTYSIQPDEVTTIVSEPTKKANVTFNFNNLDATKFSIGSTALSSVGLVDITTSLDSNKVSNGYKALTTGGQVEWCVIYDYDATNGRYRIGIDKRQMSVVSNTITGLKLFDLWDGNVTFKSDDGTWVEYWIYTTNQFNYSGSSYASKLRAGNGFYGVSADFTFTQIQQYKPQSIQLTTTNNVSTLYNSVVTVSDVYLAFKELSNGGLFGNQNGNEFTYGIQYKNADVDDNGVFDENDTYRLLQHLTGVNPIVDSFTLPKTLRLISTDTYNTIGKSNWNTITTPLGSSYSFDINTGKPTDTFNISTAWKGDVNLSHSTTPPSNGITTMNVRSMNSVISNEINASVMSENVGGKLIVTITLDPLQQELVGTQFNLNYDNTSLEFQKIEFTTKNNPTNFGTNKGSYITFGSLITDGSTILDKTTEYKITFIPKIGLNGVLGLTSISSTDAVNKGGTQLKIKLN